MVLEIVLVLAVAVATVVLRGSNNSTNSASSSRISDILFKTADTTWVAYNKYGGWNV